MIENKRIKKKVFCTTNFRYTKIMNTTINIPQDSNTNLKSVKKLIL